MCDSDGHTGASARGHGRVACGDNQRSPRSLRPDLRLPGARLAGFGVQQARVRRAALRPRLPRCPPGVLQLSGGHVRRIHRDSFKCWVVGWEALDNQ